MRSRPSVRGSPRGPIGRRVSRSRPSDERLDSTPEASGAHCVAASTSSPRYPMRRERAKGYHGRARAMKRGRMLATEIVSARDAEALALSQCLASQPFNRDGSDKTWVLHLMRRLERLVSTARLL